MAHRGQELVLGEHGRFGCLFGRAQLLLETAKLPQFGEQVRMFRCAWLVSADARGACRRGLRRRPPLRFRRREQPPGCGRCRQQEQGHRDPTEAPQPGRERKQQGERGAGEKRWAAGQPIGEQGAEGARAEQRREHGEALASEEQHGAAPGQRDQQRQELGLQVLAPCGPRAPQAQADEGEGRGREGEGEAARRGGLRVRREDGDRRRDQEREADDGQDTTPVTRSQPRWWKSKSGLAAAGVDEMALDVIHATRPGTGRGLGPRPAARRSRGRAHARAPRSAPRPSWRRAESSETKRGSRRIHAGRKAATFAKAPSEPSKPETRSAPRRARCSRRRCACAKASRRIS